MSQLEAKLSIDEIRRLPSIERLIYVERLRITYPLWNEIMARLEECYELQPFAAEPPCLMLTAKTGAGKSTLFKSFAERHPAYWTKSGKIVPVLQATILCPATVKGVASTLLFALGDPEYDRGTLTMMTKRLVHFIIECQTKVIGLDEFQHLVDRDKKKVLRTVSDYLKTLIKDETKASLILIGIEDEAEQILKANEQLARLFGDPVILRPFSWDETQPAKTIDVFRALLKQIESHLPLQEVSNLSELTRARQCFLACNGVLGYLMTLLREATRMALKTGHERLNDTLLTVAFDKQLGGIVRNIQNPFRNDLLATAQKLVTTADPIDSTNHRSKSRGSGHATIRDIV